MTNVITVTVVKGCQVAMHNAVPLARIYGLRQKHKRELPRSYIATGGVLTAEEGQDRVKRARGADKAVLSGIAAQASGRAPPKCSVCSSLVIVWKVIDISYANCISGMATGQLGGRLR